ncbi:MAG: type I methionyl aminopeptidase [Ignavibacteria bacterium]|nr:type I methionyl aminopeptidase [Ignavibacteria bacterium]
MKHSYRTRISIKTKEEIKKIEKACRIVAETLQLLSKYIKPGISTLELDEIAEDYILSKNAIPAFKGFKSDNLVFPNTLCVSIDEEVVHGIPSKNRHLKEGQIVSVDCGCSIEGYFGDSAYTYPVGKVSEEKEKLMRVSEESLMLGISQAINRNKVYDISRAIQEHCEKQGYSLTRELSGHGIGKNLHEHPSIPNFVPPLLQRNSFPNEKLLTGMALAIEPMVHQGQKEVYLALDGWMVYTADKKPAAHFEHTIIVDEDKPIILTQF